MSIFDKFFTKFAYKFNKGYPDMNNDQDVLLLESLISEAIGEKFSLEEGSKIKNHNNAKEKLINSPLGKKRNGARLWIAEPQMHSKPSD